MRICIYTKRLNQHLDEGIANLAYEVAQGLAKDHEVLTLFSVGDAREKDDMVKIPVNPFFISSKLRRAIRKFQPEVVLYIPRASATLLNFWRVRLLKWYGRAQRAIMLVLQPNEFNSLSERLARLMKPDLILTTSRKTCHDLAKMGCRAKFIHIGVNLQKFVPVTPEQKAELRKKHKLGDEDFFVLHVGHINRNRNIEMFKQIQVSGNQVLIVGSTSTPQDNVLLSELRASKIKVLIDYVMNIEEIYLLSDCYVFPVNSETACISPPLSVLEAMACNLPVISTKFEGMVDLFPKESAGLFYCEAPEEFVAKLKYLRENSEKINIATRKMVELYSLERSCKELLKHFK
jgi:glycosyltransferase involved in cell wall biosynthesis